MLASMQIAQAIKAARGSVKIQNDVELNEEVVSDLIMRLQEDIPNELMAIETPIILYA